MCGVSADLKRAAAIQETLGRLRIAWSNIMSEVPGAHSMKVTARPAAWAADQQEVEFSVRAEQREGVGRILLMLSNDFLSDTAACLMYMPQYLRANVASQCPYSKKYLTARKETHVQAH